MPKIATFFLIFIVIGLLMVGGVGAYVYSQLQPLSFSPGQTKQFVVARGAGVSTIGRQLEEQGLIKNALAFRWVVKQKGLANKIQAGSFELAPHMTLAEIAEKLTTGTNDIWVTIPEGLRREEIAESLEQYDLASYDKTQFLELSAASEGKLYPDTYLIAKDSTAETIYNVLTSTFEEKIVRDLASEIEDSKYTLDQAVIMASLIEREAANEAEMPEVAGILWNRYDIGMALQVDATLQYIKGYNAIHQDWWVPPTAADKELNSPFNTYKNPGLPPRPIANPGQAAIKAALQPAQTDAIFYIHDRQGNLHTAEDLDQHNANVAKYLR